VTFETKRFVSRGRLRLKPFGDIRLFGIVFAALLAGGGVSCRTDASEPCSHQWAGTSTSLAQAAPLSVLDLGDVGYCGGDPVSVTFAQGTHSLALGAISADPLQVVVPPWFDGASGNLGNADTTITVTGPDGTHSVSGTLHIAALAPDTSGQPTGNRSLAILASVAAAVTDARSRLSSFQGETSAMVTAFGSMLTGLNTLTSGIQRVQSTGMPISLVTVPSGATATLTPSSLATLDALFVAALGPTAGDPQSSAATAGGTADWFQSMVSDVTKGSLDSVQRFGGTVGTLLAVVGLGAAVLGVEAAAAPLAVMGAVVYAATTFAPAASALVIDFAASALGDGPEGPTDSEAWDAASPAVQYVVQQSISKAVSDLTQSEIESASPTGAAVYGVIDSAVGISDGVAEKVVSVIGGSDALCPNGALPIELGFNPDSVTCPQPPSAPMMTVDDSGPPGNVTSVCSPYSAFVQACQTLNVNYTQAYLCVSSASGPDAYQLPDGGNPTVLCAPLTDSIAAAQPSLSPSGQFIGCDPADDPMSHPQCWCCPG
jgi:hypothetical protein